MATKDKLTVDPDIKGFLAPLKPEQREGLRQQLISEGCRDSVVVWKDGTDRIVIDGHNRLEICEEEKINYNVLEMEFPDKVSVLEWMLANQTNRRNMTEEQQRYCLGLLYNKRKGEIQKPKKSKGTKPSKDAEPESTTPEPSANGAPDPTKKRTGRAPHGQNATRQIAEEEGTSESSVKRSARFVAAVEELAKDYPDFKLKVIGGNLRITTPQAEGLLKINKRDRSRVVRECLKEDCSSYREAHDTIFKPADEQTDQTASSPVYDGMNNEIKLPKLIQAFAVVPEVDKLISDIKAVRKNLNDLAKVPGAEKIVLEQDTLRSSFADLVRILGNRKPYVVCPKCDGIGSFQEKGETKKSDCKVCSQDGFLDSVTYDVYLEESSDVQE